MEGFKIQINPASPGDNQFLKQINQNTTVFADAVNKVETRVKDLEYNLTKVINDIGQVNEVLTNLNKELTPLMLKQLKRKYDSKKDRKVS